MVGHDPPSCLDPTNVSRYLFSISISVYNKWMFKEAKGDGETKNIFPFPLFTTCLHMIVQFTLASLVLFSTLR